MLEWTAFVQFKINKAYHSEIKRPTHEARFGCKPKLGHTTSFLPEDIIKDISTEGQLEKVTERVQIMEKCRFCRKKNLFKKHA